jgi:RimJ/RimL family protein N-acetyltransferase
MENNYNWQDKLIRLRAVEPTDWETFHAWNFDTEMARGTFLVPFPQSKEAARHWAEEQSSRSSDDHNFRFVIETLSGQVVGSMNTHSCDLRNGTFSDGLAIAGEHRRKGYATGAIILVLRYFFTELRYQKCTVYLYSFNEPSIELHQKLGFQLEGTLRRMVYTKNSYFDELIYGLTDDEFREKFSPVG